METIEVAESSPPKVVPAANNNNNNDDEEDVGDVVVPSSEPSAEQPEPATPDVDEVDSILLLPPEIRCEKLEMTAVASPILGLLEDAPTELPEKEVVEEKPVVEDEDLPQLLENGRASSTESSSSSLSDVDLICEKNNCKMCQKKFTSPRVLACLHVFCEPCIMDILMIDDVGLGGDRKLCTVTCPLCKQLTRLGSAGIPALQPDYVATNIIDISTLDPLQLACTSCKSKEMAISRCNDCATFLCVSCDGAHRLMRCFENHTVVQLTEMRYAAGGGGGSEERVTIHKPLFCRTHVTENLKYFCFHCQVPVCNDCLLCEHKGPEHSYELISEAEKRMKKEVEGLMIEARTKFEFCEKQTSNLDSSLHELQSQHDAARDAIQETYAAFKSVLDQCHDETLSELKRLHADRELKIMDLFHNIGESAERIETACTFTEKVLEQANAPEFLSLKKMISSQFLNLITTIPKADVNYSLKFGGNNEKFEQILRECFGKLSTEVTPPSPKETTPPPTLPGMPPQLINKAQQANSTITGSSVTASSPISLPTSMQSSFDGDMSTLGNNSSHTSSFMQNVVGVLTPEPPQHQLPPPTYVGDQPPPQILAGAAAKQPNTSNFNQQPPLQCLTSIAEYNLHRLANLAGNSPVDALAPAVPPPVVSHPANSQFTLNDLLSGDPNALNNFEAIAKNSFSEFGRRGGAPPAIMPDFPNPFVPPPPAALLQQPSGSIFNVINGGDGDFAGSQGIPGRSKATPMQIRCKFGSLGPSKGQFNAPHGFCLGLEEEIIVADTNNHRIQVFEKNGTFKSQFGIPGKDEGQLWYPRKVAVMRTNNRFVVCDRGNERSRMQIFTKMGHFIKKIAIRYIDIVAGLAVTNSGHIVAVDSVSPTVFIISEEGELVHWFDCSDYMREPSDIAINGSDFYVCDFKGHCVAVFSEHGNFIARIGTEKVTCFPNGIDISDAGDILIGDSHGNRFHVACYSRDGTLQSEFECPHVKVSRCCGLKITSEGYVVTLAKNNHHVLVLNTLYIQ